MREEETKWEGVEEWLENGCSREVCVFPVQPRLCVTIWMFSTYFLQVYYYQSLTEQLFNASLNGYLTLKTGWC